MFGVLKGSKCAMNAGERQEWMGHICGVCLALRDQAGHVSRIATNYDAALISVLCEAQMSAPPERYTSHCPLRGQFKAEVTAPSSEAAQYAASVALMMASTKVQDRVEDKETFLRHVPHTASKVAQGWADKGRQLAQQFQFNMARIETQTARQSAVEATPNRDFYYYAQPTELAVGAAFQHTAVIANQPQNAEILYEMGRLFGRIMFLLDSYEDYASDMAAKKFNALAASVKESELHAQAAQIFQEAYQGIKRAFYQLELARPEMARKLLVQQLKQRSYKVLELGGCTSCSCRMPTSNAALAARGATSTIAETAPENLWTRAADFFFRRRRRRHRHRDRSGLGCCGALICCDCCTDCCCCCDFDICECDDGACEICECECCECCECSVCECCGEGCCDCDCGCD